MHNDLSTDTEELLTKVQATGALMTVSVDLTPTRLSPESGLSLLSLLWLRCKKKKHLSRLDKVDLGMK